MRLICAKNNMFWQVIIMRSFDSLYTQKITMYTVDTGSGSAKSSGLQFFTSEILQTIKKGRGKSEKSIGSNNCRPSDTERTLFWNFCPVLFYFPKIMKLILKIYKRDLMRIT
jgi:hypothetical protein